MHPAPLPVPDLVAGVAEHDGEQAVERGRVGGPTDDTVVLNVCHLQGIAV